MTMTEKQLADCSDRYLKTLKEMVDAETSKRLIERYDTKQKAAELALLTSLTPVAWQRAERTYHLEFKVTKTLEKRFGGGLFIRVTSLGDCWYAKTKTGILYYFNYNWGDWFHVVDWKYTK